MSQYKIGNCDVNFNERTLTINENSHRIEPRVNELLKLFIESQDNILTREQIVETIYQSQVVSYGAVSRLVADLRKVFSHDQEITEYIQTIPKLGYKLCIEVKKLSIDPQTCSTSDKLVSKLLTQKRKWVLASSLLLAAFSAAAVAYFGKSELIERSNCNSVSSWLLRGSNPDAYMACIDHNEGIPAPSAFLTNTLSAPKGFATLMQKSWREEFRGQNVRLSVKLKATEINGTLDIFLRADARAAQSDVLAFINSQHLSQSIVDKTDWVERSVELFIPHDANTLVYGVFLNGEGKTWFDDIRLEVTSSPKPAFDDVPPPTNLDFSQ